MPVTFSPTSNEVLQSLLREHGYDAKISGERIVLIGYEAQMSAGVYVLQASNPIHLQLDVRVHLPDGRTLIESFSGFGDTMRDAMDDGFICCCQESFHVLLKAFFDDPHDHGVVVEKWIFPHAHFNAIVGGASVRGNFPGKEDELVRCFDAFTTLMYQASLSAHQVHWIRLYYSQQHGKVVVCEILLDNEVWQHAQDVMSSYSWPKGGDFYRVRLSLVLQPRL